MSLRDAPASVVSLRRFLAENRFSLISERFGEMGGLEQTYTGWMSWAEVHVRISADRSIWDVCVKTDPLTRWMTPDVLRTYLDHCEVGELSVDEQAEFVKTRLPDVISAAAKDPRLEQKLVKLGADHMRRLLGLKQPWWRSLVSRLRAR